MKKDRIDYQQAKKLANLAPKDFQQAMELYGDEGVINLCRAYLASQKAIVSLELALDDASK